LLDLDHTSVRGAVDELEADPQVAYAEPNFYRSSAATSDPYFGDLWGLENTGQTVNGVTGTPDADADVPEAWELTTGSPSVTTAVVDTGVDMSHPDLGAAIWRNPGESGGGAETNGVDDDRNGLVDDWRGWDWAADDNAPADVHGHGTHVAGTIAARADETGVVGVNREGMLIPLRVLGDDGSGTVADLIEGYRYAAGQGAEIVNASLAGASASQSEGDAIAAAPNTLFVVAAGNGDTDGLGDDNDAAPVYPCSYSLDNVLCVAATNQNDQVALFSNYGATSVDLGAPGTNVLSDYPGGRYRYLNGTSMATPHVAGAAGLVWGARPEATVAEVKQALLDGADPVASLAGRTVSGGRLNAAVAVRAVSEGGSLTTEAPADDEPPSARAPAEALAPASQASDAALPVRLSWSGTDDRTGQAGLRYDVDRLVGGTWKRAASSTNQTVTTGSLPFGTSHRFRDRAIDEAGNVSPWATGPAFTPRAFQESRSTITYRGRWKRLSQASALGDAVRSSTTAASTATFPFRARDVGVVMPLRATLGTARVCLDPGTAAASCSTVDLSPSSGLGARKVVFARGGLDPAARHTVRVEVVRGRVDLDAFVVLR
jgi:subtilisin family serine protease